MIEPKSFELIFLYFFYLGDSGIKNQIAAQAKQTSEETHYIIELINKKGSLKKLC